MPIPSATGTAVMAKNLPFKTLGTALVLVAATVLVIWLSREQTHESTRPAATVAQDQSVSLQPGVTDTLLVPPAVTTSMGIRTAEAKRITRPKLLQLFGSLSLDTSRLVRVRARFQGEVVDIGTVSSNGQDPDAPETARRRLRFGDQVHKDQLLAVIWSKDLGETKSQLVDALSQLRLDQETLKRLQALFPQGAVAERSLREAERKVESDLIAVAKFERTLRSWRLTEEEIEQVREEAEHNHLVQAERDFARERNWARLEVRSPAEGRILEANVVVGDLVDTNTDLYKIADLSQLTVWAHAYEEDVMLLRSLPPELRQWEVRLKADPDASPLTGSIDTISDVIDPNQHTALVVGRIDNPNEYLQSGQFVTVTIRVPPRGEEVEVPATALVEDGETSYVFVQPDPGENRFVRRHVSVSQRYRDVVYLRGRKSVGARVCEADTIEPGERVVTSGALELSTALDNLSISATAQTTRPAAE